MALKIFVDTEFSDFVMPQLISIGLASERGEEFYAEVPYTVSNCSEFVRETVIPLLGAIPNACCSVDELYLNISSWLKLVRYKEELVEICFDFQTDWELFQFSLDDRVPSWCRPRLVADSINELLRYDFYEKYSLAEHHALYDAQANRYAFREKII